jgi:hypothetical protein
MHNVGYGGMRGLVQCAEHQHLAVGSIPPAAATTIIIIMRFLGGEVLIA